MRVKAATSIPRFNAYLIVLFEGHHGVTSVGSLAQEHRDNLKTILKTFGQTPADFSSWSEEDKLAYVVRAMPLCEQCGAFSRELAQGMAGI